MAARDPREAVIELLGANRRAYAYLSRRLERWFVTRASRPCVRRENVAGLRSARRDDFEFRVTGTAETSVLHECR
jgi:hypothetical protein